jgi:hypothetical protein
MGFTSGTMTNSILAEQRHETFFMRFLFIARFMRVSVEQVFVQLQPKEACTNIRI